MSSSEDQSPVTVIDNGSYTCRVGLAGDETPRYSFRCMVGRQKFNGTDPQRDFFVGDEALARSGLLSLKYPIERGIITNWDDMEKIWRHAFHKFGTDPSDQAVLISDHYNEMAINQSQREKTMEVMFETFSVPAFAVWNSSVVALYSFGRTTGVSIDCGHDVTEISCIYEGQLFPKSAFSMAVGGCDVTNYLQKCLNERGYTFRTSGDKEFVNEIKEKTGYVALDFESEMKKPSEIVHTLPNGQDIRMSSERFRCAEVMFNPRLDYLEYDGIHQAIYDAIMNCKVDSRRDLFANICLSGSNSRIKGFPERVEKEIACLAPKGMKVKIVAPCERKYAVWIGLSILASLAFFPKMLVTRSEYNEVGPRIAHERFSCTGSKLFK